MLFRSFTVPLIVVAATTFATGCSDQGVCTTEVVPGIEIEVRDASNGDFIAGATRGVVREGAFEDSLRVVRWIGSDPALATVLGGADERPGTYHVHLEADGWEFWDTAGVEVSRDACHVQTASFTAELNPTP